MEYTSETMARQHERDRQERQADQSTLIRHEHIGKNTHFHYADRIESVHFNKDTGFVRSVVRK